MTRALFVYWKAAAGDADDAAAAVATCQRTLSAASPGLQARLYRRSDPGGGGETVTLMETYHGDDGIGAALQAVIVEASIVAGARWRIGAHHVEVFDSVD